MTLAVPISAPPPHTCMHTHTIPARLHSRAHMKTHTRECVYARTHTRTHTCPCMNTCMHTHTFTYPPTYVHTPTRSHIHTHYTRICTGTHIETLTHKHTSTQGLLLRGLCQAQGHWQRQWEKPGRKLHEAMFGSK